MLRDHTDVLVVGAEFLGSGLGTTCGKNARTARL